MYFYQKAGCVAVIGSRPREDSERQMPNRRIERAYSYRAYIPRSCFWFFSFFVYESEW